MKSIKTERKLCLCCREEHDVQTVIRIEQNTYLGAVVEHEATYEYCNRADSLLATEEMLTANYNAMIAAYMQILPPSSKGNISG